MKSFSPLFNSRAHNIKLMEIVFCPFFTGAVGGDETTDEDKEKAEEEERERLEAIREAEDRRKEKHRKMEEEREKMRQEIRDKVSAHSP
jgi:Synaphin protein